MQHRADSNQQEIVDFLRFAGASVLILSQVGNGCPDLLIGYNGNNYLIEVKYKNGRLRKKQKEFIQSWNGTAVIVAKSIEEVRKAILI